jgi:hypothetical protein
MIIEDLTQQMICTKFLIISIIYNENLYFLILMYLGIAVTSSSKILDLNFLREIKKFIKKCQVKLFTRQTLRAPIFSSKSYKFTKYI